jgi:hypothetical protein
MTIIIAYLAHSLGLPDLPTFSGDILLNFLCKMGSNWKDRPIFVGLDDLWIEADAAGDQHLPENLGSSSYWPSVPQHKPPSSTIDEPHGYGYGSFIDNPEIQGHDVHDHPARHSPSEPQRDTSRRDYDERYDYSSYLEDTPQIPSTPTRSSTPNKCSGDSRIMPSENRARHVGPPSQHEQEEAEETARDILGPRIINYPTVQFILKLQATRMDPMEWVSVKDAIKREPDAGKSLFLLAYLLHKEAKATEEEEKTVLKAQQISIREFQEARRRVNRWTSSR